MKKILSIVLFTAMILTMFVLPTSAAAWDGTSASTSLKGEGTADKPFLVETAADLAFLAKDVLAGNTYEGKYVTQTADIDLGGKLWTPIGNNNNPFCGIYDGKGNDVTGFYYSVSSAFGGFFGCIKATDANEAAVLNLNLEGKMDWDQSFVTVTDTLEGGLAGKLEGKAEKPVIVANCVVDVDITADVPKISSAKLAYFASVAGWTSNVKVYDTVNEGDINVVTDGRHLLVGGILGNAYNNTILDCVVNKGNINIEVKTGQLSVGGGMISRANGATNAACTVTNSVNYGNVTCVGNGNVYASGVIAQGFNGNTRNTSISDCVNAGKIDAKTVNASNNAYAGGMLAYENVGGITIKDCANKGEVTASGVDKEMFPGGIVGVSNFAGKTSKFENCISTMKAIGWTNDTAALAVNCVSDATVAAVDAEITAIEAVQEMAVSVTVNGVKYEYAVEAPVVPEPPVTPDTPAVPTGDAAILLAMIALVSLAGAVVAKKVSAR